MQKSVRVFRLMLTFEALISVVLLSAGCATNGRHVLLKEYSSTITPASYPALKGVTICIMPFECASNLTNPEPTTKPEQPQKFAFIGFTSDQSKSWDQEFRALEKSTTKANLREIGNLRNGFGMVMSHIYALNDPGAWLVDTLRMDLESQGAKVVDPSQTNDADICVSGTVRFCRVDAYMKVWGDLVVELDLKARQGTPSHKVVHTEGGAVEWLASTGEFYRPLRECRQKFSHLTAREISKALQQQAALR